MDLSHLYTLFSVVMIDLVLAGDNAVVVGMAAAGLPLAQRHRVIMIGVGLALLFRVLFAVVAVQLLAIIGLLLAGGLLLLWVAWKMWRELHASQAEDVGAEIVSGEMPASPPVGPVKTPRMAIVQIAIADVSMSLDNVLAVAGAARDHVAILIFGLVLSIALMGLAATWIARLLTRHHWLAYIGLVIITVVALGMIWEGGEQVWFAVEDAIDS
jgi:YjbE family integral membrane protein